MSRSTLSRWILAARPATLTAAFVPVAVGTACAFAMGGLRWGPALAALAGAVWIQIGTNFANDVFDAEKGADTDDRLGPTRAVASGLISPKAMRAAMVLAFTLASLCGVYLTWVAGWPVIAIGVASVLSGIAYTGGPYPLGYHGLGDVFVLVFFGFVAVLGTVYVQTLELSTLAWLASIPVGALATAILVVNNLRDMHTDVRAGKRTLAVRFGRRAAIAEYGVLLAAAYAVPLLLRYGVFGARRGTLILLPLLSLPSAVWLLRCVADREGRPLNATLAHTAQLLLLFGALLAVGIAWS